MVYKYINDNHYSDEHGWGTVVAETAEKIMVEYDAELEYYYIFNRKDIEDELVPFR